MKKEEKEVWRDVVGFEEFFQISSFGRVFSKRTNKILKTHVAKSGYETFTSRFGSRNSKSVCFRVHRLVATAFLERRIENMVVNHVDGNKSNNYLYNLEWVTCSENVQHAISIGLLVCNTSSVRGTGTDFCGNSKLTIEQVDEIKQQYIPRHKEFGLRAMSAKYGVSHSTLHKVIHNKTYQ